MRLNLTEKMNNVEWKNKHMLFLLLLVANTIFFALMAWMLPMRFEQNDDVIMCMIANGVYTGTPDAHLVFVNALYGSVLAWLYGLTRAVEWYTLSFAVMHVLAMTIISFSILHDDRHGNMSKGMWLVLCYVLWMRIILSFQFTTTAALLCVAGCLMLMRSPKSQWIGVCLVVVASLIRFMAAAMVGLLFAPVLVYELRLEWRRWIPIGVLLMLVIGCRMGDKLFYQTDEWHYYKQYNHERAMINDNPNAYSAMVNVDLPEGVSHEDYVLLKCFLPDPNVMNLETVSAISKAVKQVPLSQKMHNVELLSNYKPVLMILYAILLLIMVLADDKHMILPILGYAVFFTVLIMYVSLNGFIKNRVFLCLVMSVAMVSYLLLPRHMSMNGKVAIGMLVLALCGQYIAQLIQVSNDDFARREIEWKQMQEPLLKTVPDDGTLVTVGAALNLEFLEPFHIKDFDTRRYAAGWVTNIPFNKGIATSHLDFAQPNMYLMVPNNYLDERSRVNMVRQQIVQHYGVQTQIELCHQNEEYSIIQLRPVSDVCNVSDASVQLQGETTATPVD